jgi:hypothetical protein
MRPTLLKNPGLYLIDTKTGFETAIAALPFGFSSGLELMGSGRSGASRSDREEGNDR